MVPLNRVQRTFLAISRRYGDVAVVALITVVSVALSVLATWASFLVSPGVSVGMTYTMCIAIPLVVAPFASFSIVRLLTSLRAAHEELTQLASTDALTGLANRRGFFDRSTAQLASCPSGHVLVAGMIDVDRFKALNDRHGHAVGDEVLMELARRLEVAVGDHGVVGRFGGDEFSVFVTVPERDLPTITHALHAACAGIATSSGVRAEASVGLRVVDEARSVDDAMQAADFALYEMKGTRRPGETLPR